jgi:hypothetical protein
MTGPTGFTGPTGSFNIGTPLPLTFSNVSGVQTVSNDTTLIPSTYPNIFLGGFQQTPPGGNSASVSEIYFTSYSGTWWGVMSAENPSGVGYTLNYYY